MRVRVRELRFLAPVCNVRLCVRVGGHARTQAPIRAYPVFFAEHNDALIATIDIFVHINALPALHAVAVERMSERARACTHRERESARDAEHGAASACALHACGPAQPLGAAAGAWASR